MSWNGEMGGITKWGLLRKMMICLFLVRIISLPEERTLSGICGLVPWKMDVVYR